MNNPKFNVGDIIKSSDNSDYMFYRKILKIENGDYYYSLYVLHTSINIIDEFDSWRDIDVILNKWNIDSVDRSDELCQDLMRLKKLERIFNDERI